MFMLGFGSYIEQGNKKRHRNNWNQRRESVENKCEKRRAKKKFAKQWKKRK